jgi:hypothetical protein
VPDFLLGFALMRLVLTVTSLVSGIVERSPMSFLLIFLSFGLILGDGILGVIELGPHDEILEIVAAITLSLVSFLILRPGTLIIIGLGALPLVLLLGFTWTVALIGGAIRGFHGPGGAARDTVGRAIPRSARQVLRIEAGTNDLIVLSALLILIAVVREEAGLLTEWAEFIGRLLVLGPLVGFGIGGAEAWRAEFPVEPIPATAAAV